MPADARCHKYDTRLGCDLLQESVNLYADRFRS